jgi:hypothetical protein
MPNALDDGWFSGFHDVQERVSRFVGMTRSWVFLRRFLSHRVWLSLGRLHPCSAYFCFTKVCLLEFLCVLAESFVFVVGALVGEDDGFLAF